MIEKGDTVYHKPSGETWVVHEVRGDSLIPCGWPFPTYAQLSDCEKIKGTDGQTTNSKQERADEI